VHGVTSSRERDASEQFAAFVRAEGPRLLRFATLLTGSRTDAEDLVQTALTATYARWSHVADRDPGAYVRRAIVNARTSAWRRTRRATPRSGSTRGARSTTSSGRPRTTSPGPDAPGSEVGRRRVRADRGAR